MMRFSLPIGCPAIVALGLASIANAQIADVPAAFDAVVVEGTPLVFQTDGVRIPDGGHWQGAQMRFDAEGQRHWLFLSHDSATTAYVYIVEFPASLSEPGRVVHIHEFPSDGDVPPLRHSGGIQLIDHVLVVGIEDNQEKTRSEVQFWDVTDPLNFRQLSHLTLKRRGGAKTQTAGAVGLVQSGEGHTLAVANWDSRDIDFYVTNGKPLQDSECRFTHDRRWSVTTADTKDWGPSSLFGSFQSIQLLTNTHGELYLVGFHTLREGEELADLFVVDLKQPPEKTLQKIASQSITLSEDNHFRYAAGLWIDGNRLRFLASERNLQPITRLTLTP